MTSTFSDHRQKLTPGRQRAPSFAGKWLFKLAEGIVAGTVHVTTPEGDRRTFTAQAPGPEADISIHRWRMVRRMITRGDIGFAEAFIAGDWSSTDVTRLLELIAVNRDSIESKVRGVPLVRFYERLKHMMRANTKTGSRRNILAHYDLGNHFYKEWLDPTMTYSSAIYERPNDPLEDAQIRKFERLAKQLNPQPGQQILEIGCGWGGFATYLAKTYGCHVTGITLSNEQHNFARERIAREGLSDKVDIRIQDYRDVTGTYDGIASIEMFEAVGEQNWPRYFQTVTDRLADHGVAALQVITIEDSRFEDYRRNADFIQRYVFPGGMLPTPGIFQQHAASAGLHIKDSFFFGHSYAQTLAEWQERFRERWPVIESTGFDDRFRRIWDYYLAYCRAGFSTGSIDVGQFALQRR